jgi:hypothetical protein
MQNKKWDVGARLQSWAIEVPVKANGEEKGRGCASGTVEFCSHLCYRVLWAVTTMSTALVIESTVVDGRTEEILDDAQVRGEICKTTEWKQRSQAMGLLP